ncbi:MAG TPA: WD40 repeat domain-containing protein [Chloroflexia bacterium]|nr:WD40 repeat domain-containing protein [Chloroflexia bacterium]
MVGRGFNRFLGTLVALLLLTLSLLTACGQELRATPGYTPIASNIDSLPATVTPPFQAATNITPEPTQADNTAPAEVPSPTSTTIPFTPVIKPTPSTPTEGALTSDDLGIGSWSDTEVSWSPDGEIFLLHILQEGSDGDFYYLVRPPDSVQSSFKLPRSVFGTLSWSPNGRYLSYIERESDGNPGPVQVIDTAKAVTQSRRIFAGPCTAANWLPAGKLLATCGLAVYQFDLDGQGDSITNPAPETVFKLDNNRFPGSDVDLSLLFNALPSPDGTNLAMYGLRKQKGAIPLGEIAFYNISTKKLTILDRNNRPVTMVDWTPDSKYLILRNLTGDWAVPYTFDFYLADPGTLKITQNLTKSNPRCDPVLGASVDCQGKNPSTMQSSRILFSPDGSRYFYVALRYVSRPNAPIATAERLYSGKIGGKIEQVVETTPGERLLGLTWLPNGHYFYSIGQGTGAAKATIDGKNLDVGSKGAKVAPETTKAGLGSNSGFGFPLQQQPASPSPAPTTIVPVPATTAPPPPAATSAAPDSPAPATTAPETPAPPAPPTVTPTSGPRGTSLLGFDTATAQARTVAPAPPTRAPVRLEPTPTPSPKYPLSVSYFMAPSGNWILAVDRVAAADKAVQFRVRLLPYTLK